MKLALSAALCLASVATCLIIWARNVEIRVSSGFQGLIRITADVAAGNPEIGFLKLVVNVPESGEVKVANLNIVRRMHRQTASFTDGSPLPVSFPGDQGLGVALHVMNTPPTPQVFYFVGTRDELVAYLAENESHLYAVQRE